MKGLYLSELRESELYICLVSGRKCLVTSVVHGTALVYNPITGIQEHIALHSGQLAEIQRPKEVDGDKM